MASFVVVVVVCFGGGGGFGLDWKSAGMFSGANHVRREAAICQPCVHLPAFVAVASCFRQNRIFHPVPLVGKRSSPIRPPPPHTPPHYLFCLTLPTLISAQTHCSLKIIPSAANSYPLTRGIIGVQKSGEGVGGGGARQQASKNRTMVLALFAAKFACFLPLLPSPRSLIWATATPMWDHLRSPTERPDFKLCFSHRW